MNFIYTIFNTRNLDKKSEEGNIKALCTNIF